MCIFIGIEELVANALIELLEKTKEREVTLDKLCEYGAVVVRVLNKKGDEAALVLSRDKTNELVANYADLFEFKDYPDGTSAIALKENVTADILRAQFRVYLPLDVLLAFKNAESVRALGV